MIPPFSLQFQQHHRGTTQTMLDTGKKIHVYPETMFPHYIHDIYIYIYMYLYTWILQIPRKMAAVLKVRGKIPFKGYLEGLGMGICVYVYIYIIYIYAYFIQFHLHFNSQFTILPEFLSSTVTLQIHGG